MKQTEKNNVYCQQWVLTHGEQIKNAYTMTVFPQEESCPRGILDWGVLVWGTLS